ncbi:hypothetical protein [Salinilacihabitans rarus]|uniref:hypothetical protein n=1 Tax=Salinilacihabitans rarus TaxID=2961596 RepID=UPI0020C93130|nr:hypothetical protein [Salinilacihabitans rarus]
MSVEHRPSDPADHDADAESAADAEDADSPAEPSSVDSSPSAPRTAGPDDRPTVDGRLERARLRVQVAALERALAESERRRQAVVDQYELVLDGREADGTDARRRDRPLLLRVLDRLGR